MELIPLANEELSGRVSVLENKVEEHSKLLDKQQERNEGQTEMNTLTKIYIEESKETRRQMQKFSETLDKINKNLDNLNSKQELLDERVTGIESTISKQTFSIIDVLKYIGAIVAGLIVGYIATRLGIKN
jgi:chromosome segregation ATPase